MGRLRRQRTGPLGVSLGGMDQEPRYGDYPTTAAYELAWYTWRAVRRDSRLTDAESWARFEVMRERLAASDAGSDPR